MRKFGGYFILAIAFIGYLWVLRSAFAAQKKSKPQASRHSRLIPLGRKWRETGFLVRSLESLSTQRMTMSGWPSVPGRWIKMRTTLHKRLLEGSVASLHLRSWSSLRRGSLCKGGAAQGTDLVGPIGNTASRLIIRATYGTEGAARTTTKS